MYKIINSRLNDNCTTDLTLQHDDGSRITLSGCSPISIQYPKDNREEGFYDPDRISHIKLEYQYWTGDE